MEGVQGHLGLVLDPLLNEDTSGLLRHRMEEAVDGEYQAFKAKGGAYTRERFFGRYAELEKMVSHMEATRTSGA